MSDESLEASASLICEYHDQEYRPEQIWKLIDALCVNGIYATLAISEESEYEPECKWQVTLEVTDGEHYGNNPAYCETTVFGMGETVFEALTDAIGNL